MQCVKHKDKIMRFDEKKSPKIFECKYQKKIICMIMHNSLVELQLIFGKYSIKIVFPKFCTRNMPKWRFSLVTMATEKEKNYISLILKTSDKDVYIHTQIIVYETKRKKSCSKNSSKCLLIVFSLCPFRLSSFIVQKISRQQIILNSWKKLCVFLKRCFIIIHRD